MVQTLAIVATLVALAREALALVLVIIEGYRTECVSEFEHNRRSLRITLSKKLICSNFLPGQNVCLKSDVSAGQHI